MQEVSISDDLVCYVPSEDVSSNAEVAKSTIPYILYIMSGVKDNLEIDWKWIIHCFDM